MAFTEFCCRSGGSNLNAGTRTGSSTVPGVAADLTYAGGSYVQSTRVFTVASGDPVADGVAVNDYVALDTGGTTAAYIARVTARTTTTITLNSTGLGTNPVNGTYTLRVGGAWQGPSGSEDWPFDLNIASLVNASNHSVRINLRNDAPFSITASILPATNRATVKGFTTAYGDGGRAVIDGGTTGASFNLLNFSNTGRWIVEDIEFRNNGDTGSADGILMSTGGSATNNIFRNCVVHDVRGSGWGATSGGSANALEECEAYNCNQSNTASKAGFQLSGVYKTVRRCVSHDNAGSNTAGFSISGGTAIGCIADSNGGDGFLLAGQVAVTFFGCDAYNNGGDGLKSPDPGGGITSVDVENCNFVKNGGLGVRVGTSNPGNTQLTLRNCGFGSGTAANTSGDHNVPDSMPASVTGTVTYAADVTPWVDPANGDFRITLAAAKGAGRGTYTQTAASYSGTVGYPDIGAAQHQDSGGATAPSARTHFVGGGVR